MSLIFVDIETTGLERNHSTWEIAYAIDDEPVRSSIVAHSLYGADSKALELNGYRDRIGSAPDFAEQVRFENEFQKLVKGNTVAGANPAFDTKFLAKRWSTEPWHYRLLDIQAYAMGALGYETPKGLYTIATDLGVDAPDHTAAQDVETVRQCYRRLQSIYANMRRKSFV